MPPHHCTVISAKKLHHRISSTAPLRHILETKIRAFQNVHHCAIFFKKLSRITFTFLLKLPVSCLLSPVSRLLSYFSCLTSLVSLLLSSLLSHVSCLTINCLMSPVSPKKLKLGCFLKNVYNKFFYFFIAKLFFQLSFSQEVVLYLIIYYILATLTILMAILLIMALM